MNPIGRRVITVEELAGHPPRWRDGNKVAVFQLACPRGWHPGGPVVYSRWGSTGLPSAGEVGADRMKVVAQEDVFSYPPTAEGGTVEWHMNFAASEAFRYYNSGLLAQDELQVLEHPVLGSVREVLTAQKEKMLTVEGGKATPVLVTGAERVCRLATDKNAGEGRPRGLYGNEFARAEVEVVRRATTVIDPPTRSNIVCIEATAYGQGVYRREEIEQILTTAYSGFTAAREESGGGRRVVIHTGFWGCGAYGGNRVLMAMLQMIAAQLARVHRLVFHTVSETGSEALARAMEVMEEEVPNGGAGSESAEVIRRIAGLKLRWGTSDGN